MMEILVANSLDQQALYSTEVEVIKALNLALHAIARLSPSVRRNFSVTKNAIILELLNQRASSGTLVREDVSD